MDCRIVAVPSRYDLRPYAFGLQSGSPLLAALDYHLGRLRERGAARKILEQWETKPQVLK